MKLQKGLSEEEAIRDFGSMRELAAEILEAYHVKPEFDKKSSSYQPEIKWNKMKDTGKQFRKMGSFLKNKTKACIHGISRCFHWCGRKCRALALWVWKPFPKAGSAIPPKNSAINSQSRFQNRRIHQMQKAANRSHVFISPRRKAEITEKRETEKQEIVEQETEEQETEEQETEALVPSRSDYRIGERE